MSVIIPANPGFFCVYFGFVGDTGRFGILNAAPVLAWSYDDETVLPITTEGLDNGAIGYRYPNGTIEICHVGFFKDEIEALQDKEVISLLHADVEMRERLGIK